MVNRVPWNLAVGRRIYDAPRILWGRFAEGGRHACSQTRNKTAIDNFTSFRFFNDPKQGHMRFPAESRVIPLTFRRRQHEVGRTRQACVLCVSPQYVRL